MAIAASTLGTFEFNAPEGIRRPLELGRSTIAELAALILQQKR
jgi:hypothetical protein